MASVNNKQSVYNAIYHCPSKKTTTSCSNVLAKELDMRIIKTSEDGNCFFDTLATYGWAYHILSLERSPYELRQIMVDYIFNHLEDYHESIIVENGEDLFSTIEWLREDGNYAEDMGDLVSQIAADTFKVNIYIYNVEPPIIRRLRANQKPYSGDPIHMLRVGEHYKLLLPQDDAPHVIGSYASAHKNSKQSKAAVSKASVSKTAKNSNHSKNGKNGNSVHKLSKAFSMASISNHTHKNHKNHGNNSNHENHGIYEFNEKMDYKKITIKDLIAFLLSNNMNDDTYAKIEAISSLQKKKEAYYALYERLFKKK
jgi:hypothetical protein